MNNSNIISMHLVKLINRSILELDFDVKEPISVGMTNEGNIRKIATYLSSKGAVPFIPAESVKGSMRSICKKISGYSCDKGRHNITNIDAEELNKLERLKEIFSEDQLKELSKNIKLNLYYALNCPICRLFGSPMVCGKLTFSDMFASSDAKISTYTSNSINRKTRTVEKDRLFTIEYVMPTSMHLKIIANNIIDMNERRLLAMLLKVLSTKGIKIGGLKSRGYGLLSLNKERSYIKVLRLNINASKEKEEVLSNIKALTLQENYYESLTIDEYISRLESRDE